MLSILLCVWTCGVSALLLSAGHLRCNNVHRHQLMTTLDLQRHHQTTCSPCMHLCAFLHESPPMGAFARELARMPCAKPRGRKLRRSRGAAQGFLGCRIANTSAQALSALAHTGYPSVRHFPTKIRRRSSRPNRGDEMRCKASFT